MSDRETALAAAVRLEKSMGDLTTEMRSLRAYGRQNRRMIVAIGVISAVLLVMWVVIGFVALQASDASQQAKDATSVAAQNRQNAKVTCESSNIARDAQVQLWTYVLDLSERPSQTPEQKQKIESLRAYIHTVFAHRDCNNPNQPIVQSPTPVPTR